MRAKLAEIAAPPARASSGWSWRRSSTPAPAPGPLDAVLYDDFVVPDPGPIPFAQLPFDHPIYILYSSGTTGVPKAIVHGAGGTLLQHLKELLLHTDLKPEDRIFYFTTCGWMMWNWQVSALAAGATLVLYDGSPFHPDGNRLFDLAQAGSDQHLRHQRQVHRCPQEGGARARPDPRSVGAARDPLDRLAAGAGELRLRLPEHQAATCTSPRSPAAPTSSPASRSAIRSRRSGAASCRPAGSAWRSRSGTTQGEPVVGEPGELVCTRPFPSMPVALLERSRRQPLPARLLRALPGRLDARRPRRADGARRPDHLRPLGRGAQSGRGADRHRRDLSPGRADPRGDRGARGRPGLGRRSAGRAVRAPGRRREARRRPGRAHQAADPDQLHAAPRAGQDPADRRHPAHDEQQDRRAGGARGDPRPAGQERRRAGQPRSRWSCTAIFTSSGPEPLLEAADGGGCRRGACWSARCGWRCRSRSRCWCLPCSGTWRSGRRCSPGCSG